MRKFLNKAAKYLGITCIIAAVLTLIGLGIYDLRGRNREYKVGMCLQAISTEFPTCGDLKEVIAVGKDKVLIRYFHNQADKCGYEWEKHLLNRFYKEVPCSCGGLRECK